MYYLYFMSELEKIYQAYANNDLNTAQKMHEKIDKQSKTKTEKK